MAGGARPGMSRMSLLFGFTIYPKEKKNVEVTSMIM